MHLPARVGDYTDFYVGIHHATNIGKQFRPDNPLLPNYKYVPIGYHGRASSICPSGTPVRRPSGQRKGARVRYALLRSFASGWTTSLNSGFGSGPATRSASRYAIRDAGASISGYCLLNDWSARDIQAWEYQPLGPFLSKNFASTTSAWVITPEALAPFRTAQGPRSDDDPSPLPYLLDADDQREGALDLQLEVLVLTQVMREKGLLPHRLGLSNARHMYWTVAQMIAHHTSGGCNLQAGDLLGTGTISGPDPAGCGSILETTLGGKNPVRLPSGQERRFLEDGDEVILRARAAREGFVPIGFGDCRAAILPAI